MCHIRYGLNPKEGRICVAWVWKREGTEKLANGKQHSVWFVPTGIRMNGLPQNVLLNFRLEFPKSNLTIYLPSTLRVVVSQVRPGETTARRVPFIRNFRNFLLDGKHPWWAEFSFAQAHWGRYFWRPFRESGICLFLLPDSTTRHLSLKVCYLLLSIYQPSVIDRFSRKVTHLHSWAKCETRTSLCPSIISRIIWKLEGIQDGRFWWRIQIVSRGKLPWCEI